MFDPKLYCEACREIKAPEDKIEEIIAMTENTSKKKFRPLRAALICAAAAAMMVVSVAAANPDGVLEFVTRIAAVVWVDEYHTELTTDDGERVTVISIPEAEVQKRDGRAILVVNGEDEADITDALNSVGKYTYTKNSGSLTLGLTVEGTVDDWTIVMHAGGANSSSYTFRKDENGNVVASADTPAHDGLEHTWVTVSTEDGERISIDDIEIK